VLCTNHGVLDLQLGKAGVVMGLSTQDFNSNKMSRRFALAVIELTCTTTHHNG
jgi:hypothetical protein